MSGPIRHKPDDFCTRAPRQRWATTLSTAVVTDPAHLVLEATGPENVDTVVVDGRILKRGGKLVALDTPKVIAEARAALAGVRERTKWR